MDTDDVVEAADLSSQDIGNIKRRIADVLQPGETVSVLLCQIVQFSFSFIIFETD